MARIVEFWKPALPSPATGLPVYHRFLLLQNDAAVYTHIARGGPHNDDFSNWGPIDAHAEPYSDRSETHAARDFFKPEVLAKMPNRVVATGSEERLRREFDQLTEIAKQINDARIPYASRSVNSNSTDSTFLKHLGYPLDDSHGPFSGKYSPGYGNDLPIWGFDTPSERYGHVPMGPLGASPTMGPDSRPVAKRADALTAPATGERNKDDVDNQRRVSNLSDKINGGPGPNVQHLPATINRAVQLAGLPDGGLALGQRTPFPPPVSTDLNNPEGVLRGLNAGSSADSIADPLEQANQVLDYWREVYRRALMDRF